MSIIQPTWIRFHAGFMLTKELHDSPIKVCADRFWGKLFFYQQWRQKSVQKKRDVRAELLLCLFQKIAYFNSLSSPLWHPKVAIIYHFSSVLIRSDKASIPNWLFSSMNSSSTWMIFNASSEQRARASKVALRSKMGPLPHFKRNTYDLKTNTKKTRMS